MTASASYPAAPAVELEEDSTPMPANLDEEIPMTGDPPHMDIEATLRHLVGQNRMLRGQITGISLTPAELEQLRQAKQAADASGLHAVEKQVERAKKWGGWVWGMIAIIGAIFSAGVTWAVFMGENTTDSELNQTLHDELVKHNGGDPDDTGAHPDMREAINANTKAVQSVTIEVGKIEATQKKLDKRSEYQFELGRWQASVTEAERKRVKPPPKPPKLEDLEHDLMMGNYD